MFPWSHLLVIDLDLVLHPLVGKNKLGIICQYIFCQYFYIMKNFGELIKELRKKENWPQRKLAYELDIDVSVLSRIENENNFPKKRVPEIIQTVSRLFDFSEEELKQCYLSDRIASILAYEDNYETILKVSEDKVNYVRTKKTAQAEIKFSDGSN